MIWLSSDLSDSRVEPLWAGPCRWPKMVSTDHTDHCYESFFNPSLFLEGGFTTQNVEFGHIKLEITLVAMPKIKKNEYLRIGHALWASAHVMSQYLVSHPEVLNKKKVLELGCGVGLAGLVAGKLVDDPSRVVLTDGDEHVFDALEANVERNFPETECPCADPAGIGPTSFRGPPKLEVLYWGEQVEEFKQKHGTFDVILGADVLYHGPCVQPLLETVRDLLKDSTSRYLMAFQRQFGLRHKDLLLETAPAVGLGYKYVDWNDVRTILESKDPGYRESWDVDFLEFFLN